MDPQYLKKKPSSSTASPSTNSISCGSHSVLNATFCRTFSVICTSSALSRSTSCNAIYLYCADCVIYNIKFHNLLQSTHWTNGTRVPATSTAEGTEPPLSKKLQLIYLSDLGAEFLSNAINNEQRSLVWPRFHHGHMTRT